jgi:hypothetical protein
LDDRLLIRWWLCGVRDLDFWRFRRGREDLGRLGGGVILRALEFLEGAVVDTVDRIEAVLETIEDLVAVEENAAFRRNGVHVLGFATPRQVEPESRLGAGKAAEGPLAVDQGIDQHAAFGRRRVEALPVFGGQGFELSRVFAGHDLGLGVDAGFEGIEARGGLACRRARAGGALGVLTIGVNLFGC